MGQSEVQNWLKSTHSQAAVMRYPGEMKFPGGTKDAHDASLEGAARRELEEEFHTTIPADAKLRLFSVKRTKPVRGVSYMMHNFVALVDENPWLMKLDVGAVNKALEERRARFGISVNDETFWGLSNSQKESVSPEVRRVDWIPIKDATWHAMTSKAIPNLYINEFQKTEFERLGVKTRDPMFQTMWVLLDLDRFPTAAALISHCDSLPSATQLSLDASASFARTDPKKIQQEDAARFAAEEMRIQLLAAPKQPSVCLGSTGSVSVSAATSASL
jgi:long-chain acyl-CoA synthetase